jgi:hypothetical protein
MPTAGLEPTPPTPISDGPIAHPESPSPLNPTPKEKVQFVEVMGNMPMVRPKAVIPAPKKLTERQFQKRINDLGLNKDVIKNLERVRVNKKVINRPISAGVSMVYWFNSVDEMARAQKVMTELANDEAQEGKVRVAAGACTAQIGMAMARLGECIIDNAEKSDDENQSPSNKPNPQPTVLQQFNFPPVASGSARATNGTEPL